MVNVSNRMTLHFVHAAPVGDYPDAMFVGIREFPMKKVVLLTPHERMAEAKQLEEKLKPFRAPILVLELKGNLLEAMFDALARLRKAEGEDNVIVNVATGDRLSTCAALSASYVNGLRAFSVVDDQVLLLPMLKFSYNKLVSEKKTEILKALFDGETTFESLAKKVGMSGPLLSYHLNGDRETSGLVELGLVDAEERENEKVVRLADMGKLFVKGYCQ